MEDLVRRLTRLLRQKFPGSELELEQLDRDRVGGVVIWDGFKKFDHVDRQQKLSKIFKANLKANELLQISAIFALTHSEMENARRA